MAPKRYRARKWPRRDEEDTSYTAPSKKAKNNATERRKSKGKESSDAAPSASPITAASRFPTEIIENIIAFVVWPADLKNVSLVCWRWHDLAAPLHYDSMSFQIDLIRPKSPGPPGPAMSVDSGPSHELANTPTPPKKLNIVLPGTIDPEKVQQIRRLSFEVKAPFPLHPVPWNFDSILKACPKLEHLEVHLPMGLCDIAPDFRVQSAAISDDVGSEDSPKIFHELVIKASPQSLELTNAELTPLMSQLDLKPQSLSIMHLLIVDMFYVQAEALGKLINACAELHTFQLYYTETVEEFFKSSKARPDANTQLIEALDSHRNTLQKIDIIRRSREGSIASYHLGSVPKNLTFSRYSSVKTISLLEDVFLRRGNIAVVLPPNLEVLQLQNHVASEETNGNERQSGWPVITRKFRNLIKAKQNDSSLLPHLRKINWWYQDPMRAEMTPMRRRMHGIGENMYPQISPSRNEVWYLNRLREELAQVNIAFRWFVADYFIQTPHGEPFARHSWRYGGICRSEERKNEEQGYDSWDEMLHGRKPVKDYLGMGGNEFVSYSDVDDSDLEDDD